MGYDQYIYMFIRNNTPSRLVFRNAVANWGKFYTNGNKDHEISAADLHREEIRANGGLHAFSACGRAFSPSGCQGSFELHTPEGIVAARVRYTDPYRGATTLRVYSVSQEAGWIATRSDYDPNERKSPIGAVQLTIDKK